MRDYFTRRAKLGFVQRDRILGLETILMDYRYTSSIGLLLHEADLPKVDFIRSGKTGVWERLVKNF